MGSPVWMQISSTENPERVRNPKRRVLSLLSVPWAGQFAFSSSLTTHRSPFLILSRCSGPPGVHCAPRPGLDVLPTSQLRLGQRFHLGKGGGLLIAAVITVITVVIIFQAPRLPTPPPARAVPAPAFRPESPVQAFGDRNVPAPSTAGADLPLPTTRVLSAWRETGAWAGERQSARDQPPTARAHRGPRGWRPHFRRRSATVAPAGSEPRSLRSARRRRRRRPTWSRAGSRARKQHSPGTSPCRGHGRALGSDPRSAR